MNCKPGDLAIVVSGWHEYIGKIFTVTSACPVYLDHWDTNPPIYARGFRQPMSFADDTLRPIRDQPGEDETFEWAGKPADLTAPQKETA